MSRTADHAQQIDRLSSAPAAEPSPFAAFGMPGLGAPSPAPDPQPILELTGQEREDELDSLTDWVDDFLLPTYGAEVTTAAPWCLRWQEHDDVVAWLHALWLSYQQHREPDAGLAGMLVWHRDCLLHAMAAVRAPGGPLSACMTSPDRPAHRLLASPPSSARTTSARSGKDEEPEDDGSESVT
ncbi:DUF4913 domain-containing protein [Streptomyces sp. GZWMJZ-114]|uniref:DUF4913 domain-containing protein n=1 Tax=Streptomyces sp. GZWMJZ-114 TaxID=2494734 RepID=UPI0010110F2D|nr:DUF4913 domain-containing protein [Streptomyces sp. GZWMJZ-114]